MDHDVIRHAWDVLGSRTPMLSDCGQLCGSACCRPDEDGQGGVFLFPGERDLLKHCPWGQIREHPFAPILTCDAPCDRALRPMGCRIFPLTPARDRNGRWSVRMDIRARAMCPLTGSGLGGLDPAFVRAARDALRVIAEYPDGEAFLEKWAALETLYRQPLW